MIYIVDGTCHSYETVSKLERRLNAKCVSHKFWFTRVISSPELRYRMPALLVGCAPDTVIWLFVWDDSPFSGDLFGKAIQLGILPAQNCYYAAINHSGGTDWLADQISINFKGWEEHVYLIPSGSDGELNELCDTLLNLEREYRKQSRLRYFGFKESSE